MATYMRSSLLLFLVQTLTAIPFLCQQERQPARVLAVPFNPFNARSSTLLFRLATFMHVASQSDSAVVISDGGRLPPWDSEHQFDGKPWN